MKSKVFNICIISLIAIFLLPVTALADWGPKPSIFVYVKNFESQKHTLELVPVKSTSGPLGNYGISSSEGSYDESAQMMLHSYYSRSGVGFPTTFKLIIHFADGSKNETKNITPNQFKANLILDAKTGKVDIIKGIYIDFIKYRNNLVISILVALIFTIVIELLIAIPFRIRPLSAVIFVNLGTQILLHVIMLTLFYMKLYSIMNWGFYLFEIIIVVIEFYLYTRLIPLLSKKRLLYYSLLSNLATLAIGLAIKI